MPTKSNKGGFTLLELLICMVLIAVLVGMVLPVSGPSPVKAKRIRCVNNLKNAGLAHRLFATDNGDLFPQSVSGTNGGTKEILQKPFSAWRHWVTLSNELSTPKILICPKDKTKKEAPSWAALGNANISYFVNLSGDEAKPDLILAGDFEDTPGLTATNGFLTLSTNLPAFWGTKRHDGGLNVVMGDGSVQQLNATRFQKYLLDWQAATNPPQVVAVPVEPPR